MLYTINMNPLSILLNSTSERTKMLAKSTAEELHKEWLRGPRESSKYMTVSEFEQEELKAFNTKFERGLTKQSDGTKNEVTELVTKNGAIIPVAGKNLIGCKIGINGDLQQNIAQPTENLTPSMLETVRMDILKEYVKDANEEGVGRVGEVLARGFGRGTDARRPELVANEEKMLVDLAECLNDIIKREKSEPPSERAKSLENSRILNKPIAQPYTPTEELDLGM